MEPSNKKRKVQIENQAREITKQDSFSDVLQQLEAEEDASGGEIVLEIVDDKFTNNETTLKRHPHGPDPNSLL